jgi:hypothetical protein
MQSQSPATYQDKNQLTVVLLGKPRHVESSRSGRKMFPSRPPVKLPTPSTPPACNRFREQTTKFEQTEPPEFARLSVVVGSWLILLVSKASAASFDTG